MVMESTYGNRQHPTDDPRPQLAALIRKTVERGGSVVVPAFAVERTQKFLFMLKELMDDNKAVIANFREAHEVADKHDDVATASLIETFIDEAEKRCWFLFEATRGEGADKAKE